MSHHSFTNLEDVRVRLVGLTLAGAAQAAGLEAGRLREIESGSAPSIYELDRLADAYGVDPDALYDVPIRIDTADSIALLMSMDEYRDEVDDFARARVIRVANAARDLSTLRKLLGIAFDPLPELPIPDSSQAPYQQGASLAVAFRRALDLGLDPIPSVRDLVQKRLPVIGLLYARLGPHKLAGLGFADAHRGPAIALNRQGTNENPAVRRFSLAHELCHMLVDWNRAEPLATISGFLGEDESALLRERRANAFATRLLCPESVVRQLDRYRNEDAARELCERFGLHYGAARLYLRNILKVELPPEPPPSLMGLLGADAWREAEAPLGLDQFPVLDVPDERRGELARTASLAYSRGFVSRERFASLLGVSTGHALEDVLGYFEVAPPSEDDAIASA